MIINSDRQSLNTSPINHKIFLNLVGVGTHTASIQEAFENIKNELNEILIGTENIIIIAGMGGVTGSNVLPLLGKFITDKKIPVYGVATSPFNFEAAHRLERADDAIKKSKKILKDFLVFDNQSLFKIANKDSTFAEAFGIADNKIYQYIRDTIKEL